MKNLVKQLSELWPRMDEATKFRCVMLLARRAELQPTVKYLRPVYRVRIEPRCVDCQREVDMRTLPKVDQTFAPELPDFIEEKNRGR